MEDLLVPSGVPLSHELKEAIRLEIEIALKKWFLHPKTLEFFDSVSITESEFSKRYKSDFLDFFFYFLTEDFHGIESEAKISLENPIILLLQRFQIRDISVEMLLSIIHIYKISFPRQLAAWATALGFRGLSVVCGAKLGTYDGTLT